MVVKSIIKPNTFYDSVQLMRIANQLEKDSDIVDIAVLMGTNQNKSSLKQSNLLTPEVEKASPNDLFIAVEAKDEETAARAINEAEEMITGAEDKMSYSSKGPIVYSLDGALEHLPEANLAVLSIPGNYVKEEALQLLDKEINLLIFSDNVPLDDELTIKRKAAEKNLLVMGPDCGTAIIDGTALAFANKVRKGNIGLVGASGTGIQEVSSLIHNLGEGISHAIGTGSNDIKKEIMGITTIEGLKRLNEDPETDVITVVSKPPALEAAEKIMNAIKKINKPVVVLFLGAHQEIDRGENYYIAETLEDAVLKSIALASDSNLKSLKKAYNKEIRSDLQGINNEIDNLQQQQRYVRGVYSGGTYTSEAAMLLNEKMSKVYSNAGTEGCLKLPDPMVSKAHSCVDMGEDEFTAGKPHPMLEPAMRHERILQEAEDPSTAVLLIDVVLGYGVHPDPAGELTESITQARKIAEEKGRYLPVVAFVCGVEDDPQVKSEQEKKLKEAGCIVLPSNAAAVRTAAIIADRQNYENVFKEGGF
ncbi:MAG: acyl-CoA synthetase FdrA [Halanaerobiales bacterium]